jgi:hypothetical protein
MEDRGKREEAAPNCGEVSNREEGSQGSILNLNHWSW